MKNLPLFILSMVILNTAPQYLPAQDIIPRGFKRGMVVLGDSTVLSGYIREHIRSNASLVFLPLPKGERQQLDGNQVRSVQIDSVRWIAIRGDFFRVLAEGDRCFLQKAGDASAKPVYNGTEPLLINGTEGRLDDYYVYDPRTGSLTLLTRKSLGALASEMVTTYNSHHK